MTTTHHRRRRKLERTVFQTSPAARYWLRAAVAALIAVGAAAGTLWVDNPYVALVAAGCGAFSVYLGVGQVSGSVEPFVGRKLPHAEVPAPPAEPER